MRQNRYNVEATIDLGHATISGDVLMRLAPRTLDKASNRLVRHIVASSECLEGFAVGVARIYPARFTATGRSSHSRSRQVARRPAGPASAAGTASRIDPS